MSRKERILQSTIELVSADGPGALSTKKLAQHADVSEALIFKHYGSMDQLLSQLLDRCKEKIHEQIALFSPGDGREFLKQCMEWPLHMPESETWPWACYYRCLWNGVEIQSDFLQKLLDRITKAFEDIGKLDCEIEAQLFLSYMHGFFTSRLTQQVENSEQILELLRKRYT